MKKSIGKKPAAGGAKGSAAGNAKIHAVKPPKPAKRTWTITLPQEIAEIVEQQYQLVNRNAQNVIADRHGFVRGLMFAGMAAMNTTFKIIDLMISEEEKHTGKAALKRRRWMYEGAVSVMDPAKTVGIMNNLPDGVTMTYRGQDILVEKTQKITPLRVVSNKVTSIKPARETKKPKTDGPPDAA